MASGVKVSDDSKQVFEQMKLRKIDRRYVIFHIQDGFVQIESFAKKDKFYKDFQEILETLKKTCRYCLFDYPLLGTNPAGETITLNEKLVLITWCPESSTVKEKMLYASSLDAIKKSFTGLDKYIQATDLEEADEKSILEHLGWKKYNPK